MRADTEFYVGGVKWTVYGSWHQSGEEWAGFGQHIPLLVARYDDGVFVVRWDGAPATKIAGPFPDLETAAAACMMYL